MENELKFSWDAWKAAANIQKHGVAFETAISVFASNNPLIIADVRRDYGEDRYTIIGEVYSDLLSVTFADWGDTTRIISARKASRRERRRYNAR